MSVLVCNLCRGTRDDTTMKGTRSQGIDCPCLQGHACKNEVVSRMTTPSLPICEPLRVSFMASCALRGVQESQQCSPGSLLPRRLSQTLL